MILCKVKYNNEFGDRIEKTISSNGFIEFIVVKQNEKVIEEYMINT